MIDLGIGHVREPGGEAGPLTGAEYGPPAGFGPLREAIAAHLDVPVETLALTTGASLALSATLATLERPGSLLCPRPGYPLYARLAALLGLEVVHYSLVRERGWQPDAEEVARLVRPDTRAAILNWPGNPVGAPPSREAAAELAAALCRPGLVVVSDEAYADYVYEGPDPRDAVAAFDAAILVRIRSFSKLLGTPGERLGCCVAEPERLGAIARAHWTLALSAPVRAQVEALARLRHGIAPVLRRRREAFARNRDHMVGVLRDCAGLDVDPPRAGIFLWVDASGISEDADALAEACAREAGVRVMSGTAFGADRPAHLRVCFAVSGTEAGEGARALASYLGARRAAPSSASSSVASSASRREAISRC